ncbi:MAG TPA: hypothetical protein VLM40_09745, partial [Gemmata sp.]|nr:hypothetical protein [Gemmata sp.]
DLVLARVGTCWRAGWAAGLIIAVAVPLVLVNVERASRALTRLADPFGSHTWPTKTQVEIQVPESLPTRLPRGEPFDLRFVVRGVLPDRAVVSFRIADGDEFQEEYPLTAGNESRYGSSAAVVSVRIEPARLPRNFTFRIQANDFNSDWESVEVVPPPRLVPIGNRQSPQFQVVPPAYTGRPPLDIDLPVSEQWLEVPVGSTVHMRAATDVRIASAALTFTGDREPVLQAAPLACVGPLNPLAALSMPRLAECIGGDIPVSVDGSGRLLSANLSSAITGIYLLRLTDETALTATRPIRIRVVPDPSPVVLMLRPAPGKDPSLLTPEGAVPIHVTADDSLYGLRFTFLEYRVGHGGAIRSLPLQDVRDLPQTLAAIVGGPCANARIRPATARPDPRLLPLSAFTREDGTPLQSGDLLILRGAADDWDDVTPCKEPGRSSEIEILIASPDSVELWLQQNLTEIRKDLTRLREQQEEARRKMAEVVVQPNGTLSSADRDRLLAAEQTQRQLRAKITDPTEGVRAKVDLLRETVRVNRLPRSNTTNRVENVADNLGRLAERELPMIEPGLKQAREVGIEPPRASDLGLLPEVLRGVARHQKSVDDGLTDLIDLLAVWGAAGDIRTEARLLRDFVLRQASEVEQLDANPSAADLDRAGTRATQAADQASQLIGRAEALAKEKGDISAKATAAAGKKGNQAAKHRAAAAELAPGTPEKSEMNAKAAILDGERDDHLAEAKRANAEAEALRKAMAAAGGQGVADDLLRPAARAVREGKRSDALELFRSAAANLDRLIAALAEKGFDEAPDLVKLKKAADDLDRLAAEQDELRRKTAKADRIADPAKRAAELRTLAAEQERIRERGQELFQRLTREHAEDLARQTRAALDQMEAARNELENGNTGMRAQDEAVERLDTARDLSDHTVANAPQQLADEQRRKMADKVKGLLERQKSRVTEADRIHGLVARSKSWERDALVSYGDLAEAEAKIAEEVRVLEKEFAPLPVLARLLHESAGAMDTAAKRITSRTDDVDPMLAFDAELESANDRRVKRPMELAARRLEQLADALKPDDPGAKPRKKGAAGEAQAPKSP